MPINRIICALSTLFFAGLLICIILQTANSDESCDNWKVKQLPSAPDWYLNGPAKGIIPVEAIFHEDTTITCFSVSDSCKIREIGLKEREPVYDADSNIVYWRNNSELLLICRDTTQIDSAEQGFSVPSFTKDGNMMAYQKITILGEDVDRGDIFLYDISSRSKEILDCWLGRTDPVLSEFGSFIAYSDFGDLYINNLAIHAPERVFHKGGSAALGGACSAQKMSIEDIVWSPDEESLIFKFYPDRYKTQYELYLVTARQ